MKKLKKAKPKVLRAKLDTTVEDTVEKKPSKKKSANTLPPDTYKPVLDKEWDQRISDNSTLHFSVTRWGEDGTPHLDIRTYIESESYSGPTKKAVRFDVENLEEFMETLQEINSALMKKGL